eukprot:scaffold2930_cov376-Prasinococcus_capsulatus_cf.AAC.11
MGADEVGGELVRRGLAKAGVHRYLDLPHRRLHRQRVEAAVERLAHHRPLEPAQRRRGPAGWLLVAGGKLAA